jgi:glucose/arabinose dehydrogenase
VTPHASGCGGSGAPGRRGGTTEKGIVISSPRRTRRPVALLAALCLVAAGCGDDDEATEANGTATTTTTTTASDEAEEPDEVDEADEPDEPDEADEPDEVEEPDEPAPDEPDEADDTAPEQEEGTIETVATGLEAPWDVAFTPDGRTFVTERDSGRLLELDDEGGTSEVRTFEVDNTGEGGLMGLVASPEYEEDGWLYVYFTGVDDNRIVRFQVDDGEEEEVVTGIPKAVIHNGGVLRFGPDGMLYAGTGDANEEDLAQDEGSLAGKILRLEADGSIPDDNPLDGSPVWSFGHRNIQGLAWDADGRMYAVELGPDVDDEINLIEPGMNYGWPEVTGAAGVEGFVDPIAVFQPAESSPSGGVVVEGGAWDGDLVFANLRGQRLWRLELDGGEVTAEEDHLVEEYGRLRDVLQHPDGPLWILTSNRDGRGSPAEDDDRILSLVPPPP